MSEPKGILWFVLDEASVRRLREVAPPKYPNEFYHHVTLQYDVERVAVANWIGQAAQVEAYAVGSNSDAQACRVHTPGLPDMYGVPHVTLSTNDGIQPYASVAMLQREHDEMPLATPLKLTGTIEFELL